MEQSPHLIAVPRTACVAYGVPFVLQASDAELLAKMMACVPHGTLADDKAGPPGGIFALSGRYSLSTPAGALLDSPELDTILERLTQELMVYVADLAPERVFVHAGVVGWRGRALVLPGTSFAGKTTLVAELVRAGASYYSDEYAVVDAGGLVHPHARDLQMREPGRPEQKGLAVAELLGHAGVEALPVARVVFARYVAGGEWQPQPLSAGLAVLEMLRHSIPVQRTPARVMATLAAMMEPATAWRSERGDAAATARMLLAGLDL
jgi:hypothetical protein